MSLGGRSNKLTPPPCTPLPLLRDALQELNTGVTVTSSAEDLSDDFLSRFQVRVRSSWAPVQASTPNPLAVLILPLPPPPYHNTKVVVLTETPLAEAVRINEHCHKSGIALIRVGVLAPGGGWGRAGAAEWSVKGGASSTLEQD